MIGIRKMTKNDVPVLYEMALRAFRPDYEQYGHYPPVLNLRKEQFLPPLLFGKVILNDDEMIDGAFVAAFWQKGNIGSIFIDPAYQHKGYGREAMLAIEDQHPSVKIWRVDALTENQGLHRFYESLGYVKSGEMMDRTSGMAGIVYNKRL